MGDDAIDSEINKGDAPRDISVNRSEGTPVETNEEVAAVLRAVGDYEQELAEPQEEAFNLQVEARREQIAKAFSDRDLTSRDQGTMDLAEEAGESAHSRRRGRCASSRTVPPIKIWRVLHRVTYVERSLLANFGADLRPLK